MTHPLILASSSSIRKALLDQAGIPNTVEKARVDEEMIRSALLAEGASAHDIADTLAETKAQKVANKVPQGFVLGCDQILSLDDRLFKKAKDADQLKSQLRELSGKTHHLYSAAVLYQDGAPIWRHVGHVRMTMRDLSDGFINTYVAENWDQVQYCVGGYMIESTGIRLFRKIEGDYHSILGLPLLPLIEILARHEMITT